MTVESKTTFVNFFGGPCSGKSTSSAGLFYKLKQLGIDSEIVPEYPKEIAWDGHLELYKDQTHLLGECTRRMNRLNDKVDVVVMDSPLLLNIVYDCNNSKAFKDLVLEESNKYNNLNVFLTRTNPYNENGRIQSEEEAVTLDHDIYELLKETGVQFVTMTVSDDNLSALADLIQRQLEKEE